MRLPPPGRGRIVLFVALGLMAVAAVVVPVVGWAMRDVSQVAMQGAVPDEQIIRTCDGRRAQAPRQLRGMWLTTVNNIDFPSRPGLDQATIKAEYRGWLDLAERLNHNAIFVHVRPSGDALWPSKYAPWSEWLTGKRDGRDPGWDPMEFMIAEAHARNLEFHAWFNPYRGGQPGPAGPGGDINQLAPNHPLRAHPEWAVVHPVNATGSRLYFDPGIPEARAFVEDSMLEAVEKYDIDGVHFDDFFYPYPGGSNQDFPDDASFAKYGKGFSNKADWRRDNVNTLVREMSERIKKLKPWVKFGISPFGIWRNDRTDPTGSPTRGLQSFDDISADTRLWVEEEWLDYVVPQVYWHMGFDIADYRKLVPWWASITAKTRVQLYIGQADYRIGQTGPWADPAELERQLQFNKQYPVAGSVHFSAKSLRTNPLGAVDYYRDKQYGTPALVPAMRHLPSAVPNPPVLTGVERGTSGAVTVTWEPGRGRPTHSYAVYRVDGDAVSLVATVRGTTKAVDRTAAKDKTYGYCVSGLDRAYNEGGLSLAKHVL